MAHFSIDLADGPEAHMWAGSWKAHGIVWAIIGVVTRRSTLMSRSNMKLMCTHPLNERLGRSSVGRFCDC
jgi:hypothetical protein